MADETPEVVMPDSGPENLAGESKLVDQFHSKATDLFRRFQGQQARKELEDLMQTADMMLHAGSARDRTDRATAQYQKSLSNVKSTAFYRSHRLLTAGQKAVLFYGDELPARYEARPRSSDYTMEEGRRIAEGQNLVFRYYWDNGKWERKLKESLHFVNEYSHELLSCEWVKRTERRIERVPGYYTASGEPRQAKPGEDLPERMYDNDGDPLLSPFDTEGRPVSFVFVEKEKVVQDGPELIRYDLRNAWFDLNISDIQDQEAVFLRFQKPLSWWHSQPGYENVAELGEAHRYAGEKHNDILIQRASNEETSPDDEGNELIDGWVIWMRCPIEEKSWDQKLVPRWYQAVFAGQLEDKPWDGKADKSSLVCVQLRQNPYNHGRLPLNLVHTHVDDRGAVRNGYAKLLQCLWEEINTTENQLIDNKTLRNKTPWIVERGNVLSRDLVFRNGNQVIEVKPGTATTALTPLRVDDTTNQALLHLQHFEDVFNRAAGTDKAFAGEFAGSRTTGTEYQGVREQAMKPALEDAEYLADQVFPWLLESVRDLSRQFADPKETLVLTDGVGVEASVRPAELYGDLDVRVVSVGQFESDLTLRQSVVNLVSQGYDKFAQLMGQEGQVDFWKYVFRLFRVPECSKFFPMRKYREAENQARRDVRRIIEDPVAALQEGLPEPDEDHATQLRILEPARERYAILAAEPNPETIRAFDLYIAMRKQFQGEQQAAAAAQQAALPANQSVMPPELGGEAAGDVLSGVQGQQMGNPAYG